MCVGVRGRKSVLVTVCGRLSEQEHYQLGCTHSTMHGRFRDSSSSKGGQGDGTSSTASK